MSAQPQSFSQGSSQGSSVYRGASLDEVLPKIKAELGADAIILSEREGIVGGIGGFFAKKCVEVEAAPRAAVGVDTSGPAAPLLPAHLAASAYSGEPVRRKPAAEALTLSDLLAQAPAATAHRAGAGPDLRRPARPGRARPRRTCRRFRKTCCPRSSSRW